MSCLVVELSVFDNSGLKHLVLIYLYTTVEEDKVGVGVAQSHHIRLFFQVNLAGSSDVHRSGRQP